MSNILGPDGGRMPSKQVREVSSKIKHVVENTPKLLVFTMSAIPSGEFMPVMLGALNWCASMPTAYLRWPYTEAVQLSRNTEEMSRHRLDTFLGVDLSDLSLYFDACFGYAERAVDGNDTKTDWACVAFGESHLIGRCVGDIQSVVMMASENAVRQAAQRRLLSQSLRQGGA